MNRGLVLEFTKMHGAGNDFIVIDNRFFYFSTEELADIARKYCPRHLGIGADGVLALEPPNDGQHHYEMTYINADGSVGEMCGNGARCLARFAVEAGIVGTPLRFGTPAGDHDAFVDPDDHSTVRILLPAPSVVKPAFTTVQIGEDSLALSFVLAGVPHAVFFGEQIDSLPVHDWGSTVRYHSDFASAHGANVDFVELVDGTSETGLKVRCYERGVEEETLACGTGAVSSFVAAEAKGLIQGSEADVVMRGGTLRVGFTADRSQVFLEGPAELVYRGTVVL